MAPDILNDPLGQDPDPDTRVGRRRSRRLLPAVIGLLILAVAGGGWAVSSRYAEPSREAVATIEPAKPAPVAPPAAPADVTGSIKAATVEPEEDSGVKVVRPPGSAPVGPMIIKVPQEMTVALQPAPDVRLVEKSRYGILPRRSQDGVRPSEVYARPVVVDTSLKSNAPRIALVVGGMGLNAGLTASAVTNLPPAVTLGFAPYGEDLARQAQAARDAGHELLLQVPMEGFGDPASSGMSHLLMTALDGKETLDRLHWHMARLTGYIGIGNFLGGKFTSDESALTALLRDTSSRGLAYFDDGSSTRSLAGTLAPRLGVPFARADVVIDVSAEPSAIDAALGRLEAWAREHGTAIGFANGLPSSIARVAGFAQALAKRGIALVPLSALMTPAGSAKIVAQP